jgi:hypothetical protein
MRTFQSATGRFTWDDVPPDTWQVVIATRGYQQFHAGALTVVAGKTTPELEMPLLRGYAVRGRVFERRTGAGIADALVTFRGASERRGAGREGPYAKSKEDGSFVLDGVPGGDVVLIARARDHAFGEVEIVVDEKTPPQDIALSAGGTIAGTVTTTTGAPVKGNIVLHGPDVNFFSRTDDAGRFSFEHRPAGNYSLSATTTAGSARLDIVLGPDERKEDIAIVVGAGRTVRGTVRGGRPEKFKEMFVSLEQKSTSTHANARIDEQGSYALHGVPPGRAELALYSDDRHVYKAVDVPADRDIVVDIVLPPGARLSGRVTQGGKPAADKTVWMALADNSARTLFRARTSEDGRYEIDDLPPGDYHVRADGDISRPITMAGDAVLNIDIPLVQLEGRVVERGSDIPIVEADVYVRGSDAATARVRAYKSTNHFGAFNVTGIEPGEVLLTVYKAGYELYREKLAYSSPITNKTIALRSDTGVEVRVHRSSNNGEPVRGFMVSEKIAGVDRGIDLWIPLDRHGVGFLPRGLTGSTLSIHRSNDEPVVIGEWDGSPLDLTF